jgi:hypothetical protein
MNTAHVVVTLLAAAMAGYSGVVVLTRAQWITQALDDHRGTGHRGRGRLRPDPDALLDALLDVPTEQPRSVPAPHPPRAGRAPGRLVQGVRLGDPEGQHPVVHQPRQFREPRPVDDRRG